jgi:hypothetical protein
MKARVKRALRIGLAMAVVSTAGMVGASQSAFAAACTFNGCAGKDPQTTGCSSDARTWADKLNGWGDRMELRYSPSCGSVWVRMTTSGCQWIHPVMETGYIDYYNTYHRQGLFTGPALCDEGTKTGWTPMSSSRRERIKMYADSRGLSFTYLTGCNDCY